MKEITNFLKIFNRVVLVTLLIVVTSSAQEKYIPKLKREKVPPEVQKIIQETLAGQHGLFNFEAHKIDLGFDSSTKLADLKAGVPFKVYKVIIDSLEKFDENSPVSRIVKPLPIWEVPLLIDNKCVTTFEVEKSVSTQEWVAGVFNGCSDEWQKVFNAWPNSGGYYPVLVYFGTGDFYYHVPEKDDSNLTPLYRRQYDSLQKSADPTYKNLMHSRVALKYLKDHLSQKNNGGKK